MKSPIFVLRDPNALFALLNFGDIVFLCNIPLGIASKQTTQKIFGKEGGKWKLG